MQVRSFKIREEAVQVQLIVPVIEARMLAAIDLHGDITADQVRLVHKIAKDLHELLNEKPRS
jgi:hypothetical protein